MRRVFVIIFVLFSAVGCASDRFDWPKTYPVNWRFGELSAKEQEIYLATLDWMQHTWEKWDWPLPRKIYVELLGGDAPPDLLSRLSFPDYTVDVGSGYRHGRGVRFDIGKIAMSGPDEAIVQGGFLFGSVGGEWGEFRLVKRAGKWIVLGRTVTICS
jgi:hypothetical protein